MEQTLLIVKPDAVSGGHIGDILSAVERDGFKTTRIRMVVMDRATAAELYAPHKGKGFYESLVDFMTKGPAVVCVLEREDAIHGLRELLGDTDSTKAAEGTIRALYGTDKRMNAAHGSDSKESFDREYAIFFGE